MAASRDSRKCMAPTYCSPVKLKCVYFFQKPFKTKFSQMLFYYTDMSDVDLLIEVNTHI